MGARAWIDKVDEGGGGPGNRAKHRKESRLEEQTGSASSYERGSSQVRFTRSFPEPLRTVTDFCPNPTVRPDSQFRGFLAAC